MSAGCQEEDNDFHPGPCNKLHGCMKSLDHGSVQIPQVKRQVQTAIGAASVPEGGVKEFYCHRILFKKQKTVTRFGAKRLQKVPENSRTK